MFGKVMQTDFYISLQKLLFHQLMSKVEN